MQVVRLQRFLNGLNLPNFSDLKQPDTEVKNPGRYFYWIEPMLDY